MWVNFDPPLAVRIHFQKLLVWVITGKALVALFLLNFIITVWKNQKSQRVRAESSPLTLHSSATISASIYSVAALPAIVCQEKPDLLAVLWSPNSLVQPETPRRRRKLTHHNHTRMHANTLSSPGWVPLTATQMTERGSCSANKELSQVDKNWCLTTQESQRQPAILHQEKFCVLEVFPNWVSSWLWMLQTSGAVKHPVGSVSSQHLISCKLLIVQIIDLGSRLRSASRASEWAAAQTPFCLRRQNLGVRKPSGHHKSPRGRRVGQRSLIRRATSVWIAAVVHLQVLQRLSSPSGSQGLSALQGVFWSRADDSGNWIHAGELRAPEADFLEIKMAWCNSCRHLCLIKQ